REDLARHDSSSPTDRLTGEQGKVLREPAIALSTPREDLARHDSSSPTDRLTGEQGKVLREPAIALS
ncbi:hypothetical protein CTI14_72490, partial [Methylobacterium radiotolerans]